ncbi:MAG: hypothetical protein ACI381_06640 [Candidatus Methanomethylophilaceae archaeon]
MKQVVKHYTDYATFYSDYSGGNIPVGARVTARGYKSNSNYSVGYFDLISPDLPNPGWGGRRSGTSAETSYVLVDVSETVFFNTSVSNYDRWDIVVTYWE